ncbi:hypothetical protein MBLNU459_g3640t1 [Dothideomycetes sp. NU459]
MPRKMKKHAAPSAEERPSKRPKFLSDDEPSDSDAEGTSGVSLTASGAGAFQINEEYAKRFEYNKKREEKQRLEEKYGDDAEESESSTDEEEDDDALLATEDLDSEIFTVLDAIKKKDPRVYDKDSTFYAPFDPDTADADTTKKEKPMYLQDYHRKNLLEGNIDGEDEDDAPPRTYAQEQQALRDDVVNQMHAAADDEDEDGFLVKKSKAVHDDMPVAKSKQKRPKLTEADISTADRDPETFLSNFMAARAWVPGESSRFQAFDSDDSEDERRADGFEAAYNLRFEDPKSANEKLMTFSRDLAKQTARREELSGRKKQREKEREKKDAIKRERDEDKARLRKLKIEEVEEKVKKIKEAAGIKGQALDLNEWGKVLEEDWDDDRWEKEMKKRFGDNYYAEHDTALNQDEGDEEAESGNKSKTPKKPKWDDDIDIKDLIPDFEDEEETVKPEFTLSDNDDGDEDGNGDDDDGNDDEMDVDGASKPKSKKDRLKERADQKRAARKERMAIEELVDADLAASLPSSSKGGSAAGFRYRETSPTSFGLTARDILFADDKALNEFAGLKKMATWREADKKKRDRKKLGKKARLRQWRKDTFGNEDGFAGGFKEFLGGEAAGPAETPAAEGGSRKRRGKKRKAAEA